MVLRLGAESDSDGDEGAEEFKREQDLMSELAGCFEMRRPPPVLLGSGRTRLPDKFVTCMHSLSLECSSPHALSSLCREVATTTTDLGVEYGMSSIASIPANVALPWMALPTPEESGCPDHLDDDWGAPPAAQWPLVGLEGAVPIAGLLHIIHGVATNLLTMSEVMDTTVTQLQVVCKMVRQTASCDRLIERCYGDPLGRCFHAQLRRFGGKVHRKRWGTVSFAIIETLAIERALRHGWDKLKYQGGSRPADQEDMEHSVSIDMVDSAIPHAEFWARLRLLDALNNIIRRMMHWAESCPCHMALDREKASPAQRRLWDSCPLRGRRNHELAGGDVFKLLDEWAAENAATFLMDLSRPGENLSPMVRGQLMQEMETGRASVMFNFTLKLSPFSEPPWVASAVSHPDREVAISACRKCMLSTCGHPVIVELQQTRLRREAELFTEGDAVLSELPNLLVWAARLSFGYTVERIIEGEHAHLHRYVKHAPRHSMAYDSIGRREAEIKKAISDPVIFRQVSSLLSGSRNPRLCVESLGLKNHPSCALATSAWDPIWGKIIYHADPISLQKRPAADVRRAQPPDDPQDCGATNVAGDAKPNARDGGSTDPSLPLPPPASAPTCSKYEELKHKYASDFLILRLKEIWAVDRRRFFSFPMHPLALRRLSSMLAPGFSRQEGGVVPAEADPGEMVFTIAHSSPRDAHLISRSANKALDSHDIGINIHEIIREVDGGDTRTLKISARPSAAAAAEADVGSKETTVLSLILSMSQLPLPLLKRVAVWQLSPDLAFDLVEGFDAEGPPEELHHLQARLIWDLMHAPNGSLACEGLDDQQGYEALLAHLETDGIVESFIDSWVPRWRLTDAGKRCVRICHVIASPEAILRHGDVSVENMSMFELLLSLELAGFRCKVYGPDEAKEVSKLTYTIDAEKIWYLPHNLAVDRKYLIALLKAGEHGRPVPSRASAKRLREVLGMDEPVRKKRKKKGQNLEFEHNSSDSWDMGTVAAKVPPKRECRAKAKPKPRMSPASASSCNRSRSGSASPVCTRSTSSSSSSSSASHKSERVDLTQRPPSPARSDVASHRSRASIRSVDTATSVGRRRSVGVHTKFGSHFLTPKYKNWNELVSYQGTCKARGHQHCNRTLSNSTSGSEEMTLRMLKYWLVLGDTKATKQAHKDLWELVEAAKAEGSLPSLADLEAMSSVGDHVDGKEPPIAGACLADDSVSKSSSAAPSTPPDVRERCQALIRDGIILPTTEAQRRRNRRIPGTWYGVPPMFREALNHAYLAPMLPPPRGTYWKRVAPNVWTLAHRGG